MVKKKVARKKRSCKRIPWEKTPGGLNITSLVRFAMTVGLCLENSTRQIMTSFVIWRSILFAMVSYLVVDMLGGSLINRIGLRCPGLRNL